MNYAQRKTLLESWGAARGSTAILYVTGDRRQMETQMHTEVLDQFTRHLDAIGNTKTISLFLHTRGGDTMAAWGLVNLLRQFTDKLEVIVPSKAHSAGTLVCLGADSVMMTRQATLSPIDPSVNGPLNPEIQIPGGTGRLPVSVEAINGFIAFAKKEIGLESEEAGVAILSALTGKVHPLVLGQVYRSRTQIRMIGQRLIKGHLTEEAKVKKVLDFLCSESGSHDFAIYRQEARDGLGLKIETPTDPEYALIRDLHKSFSTEMRLGEPLNPEVELAGKPTTKYVYLRAIIESSAGGSDQYKSEGTYARQQIQVNGVLQNAIQDNRTLEGWRHEN